jgi:N-acetylglucosamine kinase-like BadF-type ATPase
MIDYSFDAAPSILHLRPKAALTKEDFAQIAKSVDPHIEKRDALAGIIIELSAFPGWDSLGAMAAHLRFVRDHHKRVKRIAVVTDAKLGVVAEKLASHFVAATIKHFPAGQADAAKKWIASG